MNATQNRLLSGLVLAVAMLLQACDGSAQSRFPASQSVAKSPLESEAQQVAETFLKQAYYKCGEDYFIRLQAIRPSKEWPEMDSRPVYGQIKGLAWKVEGQEVIPPPLTEAQRLNGITYPGGEWVGQILIVGTVSRLYGYENWPGLDKGLKPGKWSPWEDGFSVSFPITKQEAPCSLLARPACIFLPRKPFRSGKWAVGNPAHFSTEQINPVDCAAIPQASLKVSQVPDPKTPQIKNPSSPVPATVVADPLLVPPNATPLPTKRP